ncbi:MAG: YceI family protein [Bacteroidia bacterium]|nr:YceI family protein [Bacteroidia bacterium]MCZ2248098.1 YceI family protein [Bacteroidia bacterium]
MNFYYKIIAAFVFCFSLVGVLEANAQIFKSKKDEVKISFFSETPLENISAVNSNSTSFIMSDSVRFSLANTGFKFKKPLMQEHFNENYMESHKYPKSTFRGKINEIVDLSKDGTYKVTCTGVLYMHGVEKLITVPGVFTVKNKVVNLKANFFVKLDDYKIERPKVVMANIAESIEIKIDANYLPFESSKK